MIFFTNHLKQTKQTQDYGLWLYNVDDLFIVTSINIQRININKYAILMSYPILQCAPPVISWFISPSNYSL